MRRDDDPGDAGLGGQSRVLGRQDALDHERHRAPRPDLGDRFPGQPGDPLVLDRRRSGDPARRRPRRDAAAPAARSPTARPARAVRGPAGRRSRRALGSRPPRPAPRASGCSPCRRRRTAGTSARRPARRRPPPRGRARRSSTGRTGSPPPPLPRASRPRRPGGRGVCAAIGAIATGSADRRPRNEPETSIDRSSRSTRGTNRYRRQASTLSAQRHLVPRAARDVVVGRTGHPLDRERLERREVDDARSARRRAAARSSGARVRPGRRRRERHRRPVIAGRSAAGAELQHLPERPIAGVRIAAVDRDPLRLRIPVRIERDRSRWPSRTGDRAS